MLDSKHSVTAPSFKSGIVPETEREATWVLQSFIGSLASYVDDFEAALDLYDSVEFLQANKLIDRQFGKWKLIAARDGAMTIFHFEKVLVNSGKGFRDCPSLRNQVNHEVLRQARVRFSEVFPLAARIRHSTAHRAEMTETKQKVDSNAYSGPINTRFISVERAEGLTIDGLLGRKFTTTHEGEISDYEISESTLAELANIARLFYSGFSAIDLTVSLRAL